jgi:hypothetical protein
VGPVAPAAAQAPRLGLSDDLAYLDGSLDARQAAFRASRAAGARVVRLTLDWSLVAPRGAVKPAGFDAGDPAAPQYDWGYIEDAARDARKRGLTIVFTVVRAPRWAEGPGKHAGSPAGSWRPDPAELGLFVRAAARRFSGFYPDPKDSGDGLTRPGASLPHVRYWQIWAEPNAGRTLQGPDPVEQYRAMLNAAGRSVRVVDEDNRIVSAGASTRRGRGMAPLAFWRRLVCLTRSGRRAACPEKARFDVIAHDPVTNRNPAARLGRDDVAVATLGRLRRLVDRAARLHTVAGPRHKPLWLTKLGWDTPPLAPRGVRPATQARFLSEALYRADRAGADVVIWDGLVDRVSYLAGFPDERSGLYLRLDAPRPSLRAFRFPFVLRGSRAWGMAPHAGRVAIQLRKRRRWRTVKRVRAGRSREFRAELSTGAGRYRARQGRDRSMTWPR